MAPTLKGQNPPGQQRISSFFSKSPSTKRKDSPFDPIDLTTSDDDSRPPSSKKLKTGRSVTSSFFIRESTSSQSPVAGPSCSNPFRTSTDRPGEVNDASKWRYIPSPRDVACPTAVTSRKGKLIDTDQSASSTHEAVTPSFREKLRRRELDRKHRAELASSKHNEDLQMLEDGASLPWEKKSKRKKGDKSPPVVGPAGLPCTPLEEEVLNLKRSYRGTVLLIQVGYKYCFFGDDAKIAGEVLGFGYGQTNNFLRTSFPLHNLTVNAKKLVAAGHKVGVVSQVETAALKKAGDNRNSLFDRKLTQLFTPATFVDGLDFQDDADNAAQVSPTLMCVIETMKDQNADDRVSLGFISVSPSTGDLVYDEFEDTLLRAELETRLAHIRPCELLLPRGLSRPTEVVLRHFSENGKPPRPRVERLKQKLNHTEAFDNISRFYKGRSDGLVAELADLPKHVTIALAHTLEHLSAFGLSDVLLEANFFTRFTTRTHMVLNSTTLNNLEIYRNQTDGTERGTLFSIINQTKTIFGKRLLKSWIGRPLVDKIVLRERIDAVEEARIGGSANLAKLRDILKGLPDLAKGLSSIQYGRCTPKELATLLTAFSRIGAAFPTFRNRSEIGCTSSVWTDIIYALPQIDAPIQEILPWINLHRARDNDKENLWTDPEKFPDLDASRLAIMATESDLAEELKKARKLFKMPSLNYVSVGSNEFLIEIPKERALAVPPDWSRIGSTTKVLRYHSPQVIDLLAEREQRKETFQGEVQNAYKSFLRKIAQHYSVLRDAVNKLAIADCLMSLATLSFDENFCKPAFVETCSLSIVEGRHPVIERLKSDPFVPNTVTLGGDRPRNLVISGPNMGGKSSVVRMMAVLVILAQIGSYVPAERMDLGVHDAILTRMGASDDLAAGRSTFMVEMSETREIMDSATENSLVILDELGRGTSTFDGMAIAGAVLEHLACEVKCKTLFITHYPALARELEVRYPQDIANVHMSFREDVNLDGRREICFLYKLAGGISSGSFGIECARLAGIPSSILREAAGAADAMQRTLQMKAKNATCKTALQLLQRCVEADDVNMAPYDDFITQIKIMGL